jgi:hypothetical protein
MRVIPYIMALFVVGLLILSFSQVSWAQQYNDRFIRSFPPGYYGMWYYADKFREREPEDETPREYYRWDKYMSRVTGITYPFSPKPYNWTYGSKRTFNLPDYNTNDWR